MASPSWPQQVQWIFRILSVTVLSRATGKHMELICVGTYHAEDCSICQIIPSIDFECHAKEVSWTYCPLALTWAAKRPISQ